MDSTNDTIPPTLNVLILTEEADDNPAERKQVMDDQKPIIVMAAMRAVAGLIQPPFSSQSHLKLGTMNI